MSAEGKRLFDAGLVTEMVNHFDQAVKREQNNLVKARLQVVYARKLIEVEEFLKATSILNDAETSLGEID